MMKSYIIKSYIITSLTWYADLIPSGRNGYILVFFLSAVEKGLGDLRGILTKGCSCRT